MELRMQKELYASAATDTARPHFTLLESHNVADGVLDLVRWEGDRMLRVWKPAGELRDATVLLPLAGLAERMLSFLG
jgi:hypothetical protein